MVSSTSMALVIRKRGGSNLVIHSRGICGKVVTRACEEALTIMGNYALMKNKRDNDGILPSIYLKSGDTVTNFAHDKLTVLDGRYNVVYRLLSKVWVLVVSSINESILVSIRIVETATKAIISACQTMEVDEQAIIKYYRETYFMMGAVLNYQGSDFDQIQREALANYYSFEADSKDRHKGKAIDNSTSIHVKTNNLDKNRLNALHMTYETMEFEVPSEMVKEDIQLYDIKEIGNNNIDSEYLSIQNSKNAINQSLSFDDLNLLNKTTTSSQVQNSNVKASGIDALDDFFKSNNNVEENQVKAQNNNIVEMKDSLVLTKINENDVDNSFEKTNWVPFTTTDDNVSMKQSNLFKDNLSAPINVSMQQTPVINKKKVDDVLLPDFILIEHWNAFYKGCQVQDSSAYGEVKLLSDVINNRNCKFSLNVNSDVHPSIKHSLKCCKIRNLKLDEDEKIFEITEQNMNPTLKYNLFMGSFDIPLSLITYIAIQDFKEQLACRVLVIELHSNPKIKGNISGILSLKYSENLGLPFFVRPRPHCCKKQNRMKWNIKNMGKGKSLLFRVVFPADTDTDSGVNVDMKHLILKQMSDDILIKGHFHSEPGYNFTGIGISQDNQKSSHLLPTQNAIGWQVQITASP